MSLCGIAAHSRRSSSAVTWVRTMKRLTAGSLRKARTGSRSAAVGSRSSRSPTYVGHGAGRSVAVPVDAKAFTGVRLSPDAAARDLI